jgi:hypothetical protein
MRPSYLMCGFCRVGHGVDLSTPHWEELVRYRPLVIRKLGAAEGGVLRDSKWYEPGWRASHVRNH